MTIERNTKSILSLIPITRSPINVYNSIFQEYRLILEKEIQFYKISCLTPLNISGYFCVSF